MNYGKLIITKIKSVAILDKDTNLFKKIDTPLWLKNICINTDCYSNSMIVKSREMSINLEAEDYDEQIKQEISR